MSRRRRKLHRGGNSRDERARKRALENLSAGPDATVRHGVYRWLHRAIAPPCDKCPTTVECDAYQPDATCALAEQHQENLVHQIMALPHIQDSDYPLAVEYAKLATGLAVIDHYLGTHSPLRTDRPEGILEPQPVLAKTRMSISNSMVRLASELGLSPASRARLQRSGDDGFARQLGNALAELRQREEEPHAVDAEFTAEDDGDE